MPRERNLRKDLPKNKPSKRAPPTKTQHAPLQLQASKKAPARPVPKNAHPKIQQLMLDAFDESFAHHADSTNLIRELKQHLFHRDFSSAFGRPDLREAYASRWSPSRALAYWDLFGDCEVLTDAWEDLLLKRPARRTAANAAWGNGSAAEEVVVARPSSPGAGKASSSSSSPPPASTAHELDPGPEHEVKVTCLGAGSGAEVVAFAAYLHWLFYSDSEDGRAGDGDPPSVKALRLQTIDIANWSGVIDSLVSTIVSPTRCSDPAPSPQPATKQLSIEPSQFSTSFTQLDLLSPDFSPLAGSLQSSAVVTLIFTLNELYTTSMSRTTTLLLTLTSVIKPRSLLLVVNSPSSYSTVKLNQRTESGAEGSEETATEEKRYPMQWLLDHTLIEASSVGSSANVSGVKQWEKVHEKASRWFRRPKGLRYPIELEDMRYQVHLYRKL